MCAATAKAMSSCWRWMRAGTSDEARDRGQVGDEACRDDDHKVGCVTGAQAGAISKTYPGKPPSVRSRQVSACTLAYPSMPQPDPKLFLIIQ